MQDFDLRRPEWGRGTGPRVLQRAARRSLPCSRRWSHSHGIGRPRTVQMSLVLKYGTGRSALESGADISVCPRTALQPQHAGRGEATPSERSTGVPPVSSHYPARHPRGL